MGAAGRGQGSRKLWEHRLSGLGLVPAGGAAAGAWGLAEMGWRQEKSVLYFSLPAEPRRIAAAHAWVVRSSSEGRFGLEGAAKIIWLRDISCLLLSEHCRHFLACECPSSPSPIAHAPLCTGKVRAIPSRLDTGSSLVLVSLGSFPHPNTS